MYGQFNGTASFGFPNMQSRLNNIDAQYSNQGYAQYNNRQQMMPSYLKGRMVTSIDEAKASQYDLDGTITFFPSLNEGKIYAKTLDNNGLPVFMQFVMQAEQAAQPDNAGMMENLVKRVERLEKELGYDSSGNSSGNAKQ